MMEIPFGKSKRRENAKESPAAKRVHSDLFSVILDEDDIDGGDRDPASQDLAIVMKSLKDEISRPPEEIAGGEYLEIGYLLEASGADLGFPLPAQLISAEGSGQIWSFDDGGYLEFGAFPDESFLKAENYAAGEAASSDGGGSFDASEFYLRPESVPAQLKGVR